MQSGVVSASLAGQNNLVKESSGTVVLSGANSYDNFTIIQAGTLAITGAGTLGSPINPLIIEGGTVDLGGTTQTIGYLSQTGGTVQNGTLNALDFSSQTANIGATLAGSGYLAAAGGTTTLSGVNTYTRPTYIGTPAGLGVQFSVPSILALTGAGSISASGMIVDYGILDISGTTTGTSITTLAGSGQVLLGAKTLTITNGQSSIFTGTISGTGGLTQTGTGVFALNGTNTYTGPTTVVGGRLDVNGLIVSATTVQSGALLGGSGTIGSVLIQTGGTLTPGRVATMGTLNVTGPLTFLPGSFYNVRVTPTTSDQTTVVGAITIGGGTVNVLAGSGVYQPQSRYDILTASGGVSGTFSGVASNLAFLTPTLSYDAKDVFLVLNRNDLSFASVAVTQNERAVATALDRASPTATSAKGGSLLNAVANLSVAQAPTAFDSLSGEGITAAQNVAHRSSELFTDSIFDQTTFYGSDRGGNSITLTAPTPGGGLTALAPNDGIATTFRSTPLRELADLPSTRAIPVPAPEPIRTWRAWGTGFGGEDNIHSNGMLGTAAQNNTIYGGTVGVDYQLTPNYLAGVAVGGSNGDFSVPNRATSGSTTGGHIAFYDLATFAGGFYGASTSSASFYQNNTTRNVAGFGGLLSETEKGSFFSDEFRTRLEVGRQLVGAFGLGSVGSITPFIALELAELRSNGFGEQAIGGPGVFALNVSGQSTADVPSFVGARFARVTPLGNGMVLSPTLQLAYVHEFAPYRQQFATLASLPGSTFLVDGARPSRNAAQVKVGGELAIGPRSVIFVNFDGEFSGAEQLYAGKGGFKYLF